MRSWRPRKECNVAAKKVKLQKRLFVVFDPADGMYSSFTNKAEAKEFAADLDSYNDAYTTDGVHQKATVAAYTLEG